MDKKALLVVSFGTSYHETREKTIDCLERELSAAFPQYTLYRAWTSKMIIKKLKNRDGIHIDTVAEAMERMEADGVTDLIVQPTHILNGIENDFMITDILLHAKKFNSVKFGDPLLMYTEDFFATIKGVMSHFSLAKEDALVFMGHGTTHHINSGYAALDYMFKDMGYENVFMGTVESYPDFPTMLKFLKKFAPKKVVLAPFMIVAGDHANNDMAGDDDDAWKTLLEKEGYTVDCVLRGLGEYPEIRSVFVDHAKNARPIEEI